MSTETELKFHPGAADSFRERGERLLSAVKPIQDERVGRQFRAERHPTATFTEKDISRIRRETVNCLTMEVSDIAFPAGDDLVGLAKEECEEVDKLSEAIQRTTDFRPRVSRKFLRNTILDWLEARVLAQTDKDLPSYILEKANSAVTLFQIWVPLANLALEHEIRLGPVRVRPISREQLDSWYTEVREGKTPDDLEILDQVLEKERAKLQGLAAACITLRAERQFAVDKALEKAEEVAACFRLFHPANSQPRAAFYCRALGRENQESYSVLVVKNDKYEGRTDHMIPPYPVIWALSSEQLTALEEDLNLIRALLAVGQKTEFQQEALDAVLLYTRSTMIREPVDKLVFIFSALESVLLKNEMEPIQTHIADRLAFVLGVSVEERKSIVRLVRTCYGFRSKFIHHGRTLEDFDTIAEFMKYVWVFFIRLTKFAHQYATRSEFLEAIETRKYSGP
ncbi:MAG TPA: hypothetical protein VGG03_11850 [Thermoanaerobaculia bacterium]